MSTLPHTIPRSLEMLVILEVNLHKTGTCICAIQQSEIWEMKYAICSSLPQINIDKALDLVLELSAPI